MNRWTAYGSWTTQSTTVEDGNYAAYCAGAAADRQLTKSITLTSGYMIHEWARSASASSYDGYPVVDITSSGSLVYSVVFYGGFFKYYQGSYTNWPSSNTYSTNTWYKIERGVNWATKTQKAWQNGNYMGSINFRDESGGTPTQINSVNAYTGSYSTGNMWIDDYYITKYVDPEPAHSTWGSEESSADTTPPVVTIQSPANTSYANTTSVWANVTLNEAGSWCGRSLDGGSNLTMLNSSGNWNNQMAGLSFGGHSVRFYCNDTAGNMNSSASNIVYFTVATPVTPTNLVQSASPISSAVWNIRNIQLQLLQN